MTAGKSQAKAWERDNQSGVNRRELILTGITSAALPLLSSSFIPKARAATDTSTSQRAWAQKHLRGVANLLMPSFMPDLHTLDDDGVRIEVQNTIAQGFCATMPAASWTSGNDPQWVRFNEVVLEAVAGRIQVHGSSRGNDIEDEISEIRRMEKKGYSMLMVAPPHTKDGSADDLYESYRRRITATELPVVLYAALSYGMNYPHLGPAGIPLDVYDRLADLPNVVAMKVSHPVSLTSHVQICERLSDRILIGPVNLDFVPLLGRYYNIRWSGQWNAEAVQTPNRKLAVDLLAAVATKDRKRTDMLATAIQPIVDLFYSIQAPTILHGGHPWQHNKYFSWLGGGNGGLIPIDPHEPEAAIPTLDAPTRRKLRDAFAETGLSVTDAPDEQFIVGRAAWTRGVRPDDVLSRPRYAS